MRPNPHHDRHDLPESTARPISRAGTGSSVARARGSLGSSGAWRIVPAVVSAFLFIGCSGRVPPPDITKDPYTGPPLSLEDWDGRQLIVARPPSAGHSVQLDRVLDGWGHQAAYLTIRTPNPAFSYAMTPVLQRVETNVHTSTPLEVYARVEDFTGKSATGDAYSAVEIAPVVPNPQPVRPSTTPASRPNPPAIPAPATPVPPVTNTTPPKAP